MQKSKYLKNPVGTDAWKITSNLSTHDTLVFGYPEKYHDSYIGGAN